MKKPNFYDETQTSERASVELGGHTAVIKSVEERETKAGKPMVVVCIDFDKADSQPDYFQTMYDGDDRIEKKWPYQGTQYIVTEDQDGKCSRSFKSFCTSFESSNSVRVSWGSNWGKQFIGKKIGVIFGEVEEEYNGEVRTRRRIRWFCSYDAAQGSNIPMKKELPKQTPAPVDNDGFMNLPEDDTVPW